MTRSAVEEFLDVLEAAGYGMAQDEIDTLRVTRLGDDQYGVFFATEDGLDGEFIVTKFLRNDWLAEPTYSGTDYVDALEACMELCK